MPAAQSIAPVNTNHSAGGALERLEAVAAAFSSAGAEDQSELRLEYLALIGELLLEQGHGTAVLGPLLDIHETMDAAYLKQRSTKIENERRRSMQTAGPRVMARVAAVIDLLVASGMSTDHAAQITSRQLLARKLDLPEEGGDSRGWKRVQIWHHRLVTIGRTHPQFKAAQAFKIELLEIHGPDAAALAVSQPLWDRRSAR